MLDAATPCVQVGEGYDKKITFYIKNLEKKGNLKKVKASYKLSVEAKAAKGKADKAAKKAAKPVGEKKVVAKVWLVVLIAAQALCGCQFVCVTPDSHSTHSTPRLSTGTPFTLCLRAISLFVYPLKCSFAPPYSFQRVHHLGGF